MAVAVSGGPDSFALLHALHEKSVPFVGLTVDHGLRPEAAEEAAKVAQWCAERGIAHEILRWEHGPASSFETPPEAAPQDEASRPHPEEGAARLEGRGQKGNLQARARTARYRLLCEACNRLCIETLVTGHTADDQAETVFMRLRRGSGRGLAGMPRRRLIASGAGEPVTLYRPLLGVRRSATQSYAAAHDLPVSQDPSNEDEKFERVRVRALLAALEQQDVLTVEALCRTAGEVTSFSAMSDSEAGEATADGAMICSGDSALDAAVFAVGGRAQPLPGTGERSKAAQQASGEGEEDLEPLTLSLSPEPGRGDASGKRVLGGAIVEKSEGRWIIYREPAALLGRKDLSPRPPVHGGTGASEARRGGEDGVKSPPSTSGMSVPPQAGGQGSSYGGGFEPIPVSPGEKCLYDRRFIVHVPHRIQENTVLRPLGALMPRDIAVSTLDRMRISTLPCLSSGDRLTHLPAAVKDFVGEALAGWKQAGPFLDKVGTFEAVSLLEERFSGRVIRF